MAQVVVLDSINEDIFVCGVCKLVFNSLQIFLDHKKQECRNEPSMNASSSWENIVTTISQNIDLHQTISTSNPVTPLENVSTEASCKLCTKTFKKVKSLLAHLKTHSDRPYQCPVCGRCFGQNSHLQRHIASHKVWPDGLTETTPKSAEAELLSYSCAYCDLTLPNYSQFRMHLKKHQSNKKFKCIQSNCIGLFSNIECLLDHVSCSHATTVYQCHICNQMFNTLEDIAAHQHAHIEPENNVHDTTAVRHKCAQCDAVFKNPERLSLHLLTENHKKVCIHCNKMFASDKRLRLHLQIHRKNKPFQCNICDSSFHMKKYLSSHMLKHGDKQYACSVCKHKFKRKDLLQRHMKSHQKKKLFKCPFRDTLDCLKEFSRSDKLKSHVKFHTKRMVAKSPQQSVHENPGTVEICIVPLDGSNSRQFRVTDQVYLDIQDESKPLGRVVIGLFGDLAPKAVKNFKVLATKGIKGKSYKGTSFNRIIKRFMVQGGDVVSDDGSGSISIYGETFQDENLDTQHTMAGFVSMANKGKDTNGCQFIITTTGTPWLDNLHTVVGKVVEGQNVVHMLEHTPTDVEDRPLRRVRVADCGLLPTQPFYISDDPYDLWAWIKASTVPLTMSFSILGFFHWMIRKMEI